MSELTLTKELLLGYANHASAIVREAAYARIAAEMFKENGLVSPDDISFNGSQALDVYVFYDNLTAMPDRFENRETAWKKYKEIILRDSENREIIALKLLAQAKKNKETAFTDFVCGYIRDITPGICESGIICELLDNRNNDSFIRLATERIFLLKEFYPEIIDCLANLAAFKLEASLDIAEKLLTQETWRQPRMIEYFADIVRNCKFENVSVSQRVFRNLVACVTGIKFTDDGNVDKANGMIFELHRKGLLPDAVMLEIIAAELDSAIGGKDRLVWNFMQSLKTVFNRNISGAAQQLELFRKLSQMNLKPKLRAELLRTICLIIRKMRKDKVSQSDINKYDALCMQLLSDMKHLPYDHYVWCAEFWINQRDIRKLRLLAQKATPNQYRSLLKMAAEENGKWWLDVPSVILSFKLEDREDLIRCLISLGNKFKKRRSRIAADLQNILEHSLFDAQTAGQIRTCLGENAWLKNLTVKTIPAEDNIEEILKLLGI